MPNDVTITLSLEQVNTAVREYVQREFGLTPRQVLPKITKQGFWASDVHVSLTGFTASVVAKLSAPEGEV